MVNEVSQLKKELGMKWVQSETGTTYLCPIDALKGLDNPTDEQLRSLCVDESMNPHNQ